MEGNVLVSGAKTGAAAPAEPQRVINLVSNAPANKVVGIAGFLKVFNSPQVRAEITPFRHVIQRKTRRSLGGKFGKGLSEEVTENIEVNPNEDLFGLRRWLGGIRQDPANVMLVNVGKLSLEPLAAPLVFSEMIRSGRPILVTGCDASMQDQLLSPIDLTFAAVPPAVQHNPALKLSLASRVHRRKGFISSIRSVLELESVPKALADKIAAINSGADPSGLTEAEVVNLCLLGDLVSRYMPAIVQFREALRNSSLQVPQLVSMFEILTADLTLAQTVEAFQAFFPEEVRADPSRLKSRGQVFGEIYRFLQSREGSGKGGRMERMDDFFRKLTTLVAQHRAKVDPMLWRHCHFLGDPDPVEQEMLANLRPYYTLVAKALEGGPQAITPEFMGKLGEGVFDLVQAANQPVNPAAQAQSHLRKAMAARLLPLFRLQKFAASSLVSISDKNREVLLNQERFLSLFRKIPVTAEELKALAARLRGAVMHNEVVSEEVRRSTLDVLIAYARDREKLLRDIYILSAVPELAHFGFLLGEAGLSPIERNTALAIAQNRLGLEFVTEPNQPKLVPICAHAGEPPLGTLKNDPDLVSRAYSTLIGLRVQSLVKRAVDHKINYLTSTFGENFFEVIYETVVARNDLPLSRNQLAWFIQQHNLLGNLQARGWKQGQENELVDDFLTLEVLAPGGQRRQRERRAFPDFDKKYAALAKQFAELLDTLKASAEKDDRGDNPDRLIWSLYRQGVYNLSRAEAREQFRKSIFYNYLKEMIAQISSENYSVFTKEIQQEGVKIYVPRKYFYFITIGSRFSFLVGDKVVRYQLIATPKEKIEDLDTLSRVFVEKLDERFNAPQPLPDAVALRRMGEQITRCNLLWWEYSRHLAFALMDRVLSETIIKQLEPGAILAQHLWYLPDETKLCLGPALVSSDKVPFQKILQVPENMGNIQKNPKSCSTTIDDFAIEVHKITRLREELETIAGIAEDVLDILQNLTHSKLESPLVAKYEQNLGALIKLISLPLRHLTEKEVQLLHEAAKAVKETLQAFYQTPGSAKDLFVSLLQNQLRARRSDGHLLKLNFTDQFILAKTEIKVVQRVKQGDSTVSRQKKVEVEVDASYQTLATRIRDVIRTHELLAAKEHIVFSPEGQKKKQIDYVADIIDTLQALRGTALTFYCDQTMLDESQVQQLATRIKPHHFFKMEELRPEPPKGMAVTRSKDPLTGRPVMTAAANGREGTRPAPPAEETVLTSARDSAVRYKFDPATRSYAYLAPETNEAIPARSLPVDLGTDVPARILMARLPTGKVVFHGLYGNELLLPLGEKQEPPTVCAFEFLDRKVRVVNEGGRPVVRVDQVEDDFLKELRSLN